MNQEPKELKLERDNYYKMVVTVDSNTSFVIYSPGYKMRSWMAFQDKLKNTYTYTESTLQEYQKYVFGVVL